MADARIFEDLKADHARHREMLAKLGETSGASEERQPLFEDLRKELQAHAAAEEESLYATMLACPDLRDEARHSVSEHKEIDDYLGELLEIDMASSSWLTKFKEMRHRYLHHIDEEEEDHFPDFAKHLTRDDEIHMEKVFETRKREEKAAAEVTPESKEDAKE